jgi:hypothetical protein
VVGLYLAASASEPPAGGKKPSAVRTIERRLSAISWNCAQRGQPLDRAGRHIAEVMTGIRRRHARPPDQKEAVFADDLLRMIATLDHGLRGLRPRHPADRVRRRPAPQRNHRARLRARPHRGRRRLDRVPGPGRQDRVARSRDRPRLQRALARAEWDPQFKARLLDALDRQLTDPDDRALFGLSRRPPPDI